MDLTASIVPKSDQWNADDLISGPVTVTIESVTAGSSEQPVDVRIVETPGKAYRPSKSMRRVMVEAWGKESSAYAGHRLTLFRNPKIKFGGQAVGGIEIAAMSHIDKPLTMALTRSKGKREPFTVKPLPQAPTGAGSPLTNGATPAPERSGVEVSDGVPAPSAQRPSAQPEPTAEQVDACTDVDALKGMWRTSGPELRTQIEARVTELNAYNAAQDGAS